MKKLFFLFSFLVANMATVLAQVERPKIVVGIVVDQMRWDYLMRYNDRYCDGGFKRMMREGVSCNNMMINYIPTITAVGHTCIFTGSVPALTGITGNSFFIEQEQRKIYCCQDDSVESVGSKNAAGKMSPHNMLVTTITDELRLAYNFRNKTIGVALKDRAAILPAGHTANGAYWYDTKDNCFITSTYYMNELPKWVKDFNKQELGKKYLKQGWGNLLFDESTYVQSTKKASPYEAELDPKEIKHTHWGNNLTLAMAKAAIEGEKLGQNGLCDFLTVSFSAPDAISHLVGPNSILMEDCYLRLDRELADFFNYLDGKFGKDGYLAFLTADHAGAHNPSFLIDHKLPGGAWDDKTVCKELNKAINEKFGLKDDVVMSAKNYQIHLNYRTIGEQKADVAALKKFIIEQMLKRPDVHYAFDINNMPEYLPARLKEQVANGYNPKRSGEIALILENGYSEIIDKRNGIYLGNSHGVWSPYDAHIPFMLMGWHVPHGVADNRTHHITDISTTVANMLGIQMPSGCLGDVIEWK